MKLGVWEWRLHYRGDVQDVKELPDTFCQFEHLGVRYQVEALELGEGDRAEVEVVRPDWRSQRLDNPGLLAEIDRVGARLSKVYAPTTDDVRVLYARYIELLTQKKDRGL